MLAHGHRRRTPLHLQGRRRTPNSYDPGDPATYKQFIHALITDSRDYENSVLAPKRDEAQKYYYGMLPSLNPNGSPYSDTLIVEDPNATYEEILGPSEGPSKSSFVSTDVRDAILMMLPSLVRIFAASENVISLVPRSPQDDAMAEQATNYVNYVFWQDNAGFLTLYGAFKDAMTVKTGYIKWWTDNTKEVKRKQFVNITMEQLQMLLAEDPTAKVVPGTLQQNDTGGLDVTIEGTANKPITRVEGVPPEEMRLDRYARTFAKSRIVGHERIVSIDELTAMGYPRDLAANYLQTQDIHNFTMESDDPEPRPGHVDPRRRRRPVRRVVHPRRQRRRWRGRAALRLHHGRGPRHRPRRARQPDQVRACSAATRSPTPSSATASRT